jgi:hypothetical protein
MIGFTSICDYRCPINFEWRAMRRQEFIQLLDTSSKLSFFEFSPTLKRTYWERRLRKQNSFLCLTATTVDEVKATPLVSAQKTVFLVLLYTPNACLSLLTLLSFLLFLPTFLRFVLRQKVRIAILLSRSKSLQGLKTQSYYCAPLVLWFTIMSGLQRKLPKGRDSSYQISRMPPRSVLIQSPRGLRN